MTPQWKLIWTSAAAAAVLILGATAPAVGQAVKSFSLIRNDDEPGRNPYESTVIFNQNVSSQLRNPCFPGFCGVIFAAVPSGKRLVLQNVTGVLRVSQNNIRLITLAEDTTETAQVSVFPIDGNAFTQDFLYAASTLYSFNHSVKGYVEAGQSPVLNIVGPEIFRTNVGQPSQVKLTGYLVDLQQ